MDKALKLQDSFEQLESLNPKAGEYLNLLLDMVGDYDVPPFTSSPELGMRCFQNGLEDDINEVLALLGECNDEIYLRDIKNALKNLKEILRERPFSLHVLAPIFNHYLGDEIVSEDLSTPKQHYYVPNIEMDQTDVERFLAACGLTQETKGGKGAHTKWFDAKGRFVQTSYKTSTRWLKRVITTLLDNGVELESIKNACTKLKIEFRILD